MSTAARASTDLPPVCHAQHPETGSVILIRRGEPGYSPVETRLSVETLNACLDPVPTALQVEAMLIGSMFGWDAPGAQPAVLRERRRGLS